jgi:hypothetical protein
VVSDKVDLWFLICGWQVRFLKPDGSNSLVLKLGPDGSKSLVLKDTAFMSSSGWYSTPQRVVQDIVQVSSCMHCTVCMHVVITDSVAIIAGQCSVVSTAAHTGIMYQGVWLAVL